MGKTVHTQELVGHHPEPTASQRIDAKEVVGPTAAGVSVREVARALGVAPSADQPGEALDGRLV